MAIERPRDDWKPIYAQIHQSGAHGVDFSGIVASNQHVRGDRIWIGRTVSLAANDAIDDAKVRLFDRAAVLSVPSRFA